MKLNRITDIIADESGATAIEYGLIAAVLAVGILTALGTLKGELNTLFGTTIANGLKPAS